MGALDRALTSRSREARLVALGVVAAVTVFLVSVLVATAVAPGLRFAQDDFIYLEGGWRVLQGQRPHVDFHTPMGALTPLLFALAMKLHGANAQAFGVAVPLFATVVAVWAFPLASARLSAVFAAAYTLVVLAVATGQHALGFDYGDISYASLVDRFGYALLALVLLECITPPREAEPPSTRVLGGASTGAALGLLLFLKAGFLVPALALVLVSSAYRRTARDRWWAMGAGAFLVAAALFAAARTTPGAMLRDYTDGLVARQGFAPPGPGNLFLAMADRSSFGASPSKLLEILRQDFWSLLALAGVAAVATTPVPGVEPVYATRRWLFALALIVVGFTIPVCVTSWQWGEMPVMAAAGIVLAEQSARASAPSAAGPVPASALGRSAAAAGLVAFLAGSVVLKNAGSTLLAWSVGDSYAHSKRQVKLSADALKGMVLRRSDGTCEPERYAEKIADGLELLGKASPARPVILVADSDDPFTFALHASPPRGTELWWRLGLTFSGDTAPATATVLQDVNVVMVPKCPEDLATRDVMLDLYGGDLDRDFEEGGHSGGWLMLVRKK
jgi:hypothetical protein